MLPSTGAEDGQRFMAFMLEDKIGVIKLPLTGNPHLASALIVHPQGVCAVSFMACLSCSYMCEITFIHVRMKLFHSVFRILAWSEIKLSLLGELSVQIFMSFSVSD